MNAASKALAQTLYGSETVWDVFLSKQLFLVITLSLAIFISSLTVVYSRYSNRRLFINVQTEKSQQRQLQTDYSELLFEHSKWSNQARIEQIATTQLHMEVPAIKNIILINA